MCAVGNILKSLDIPNKEVKEVNLPVHGRWRILFETTDEGIQINWEDHWSNNKEWIEEAKRVISYSDFTQKELAEIEFAFETNTKIRIEDYKFYTKEEIRKDQINGLKAVIGVMLTFNSQKNKEKVDIDEVFTKRVEFIPIH